ncbi:RibD family protein [Dialister sp.]|jgi:riboflavin biosynthesis pyrimidine reductase|uniref:RibD family protein n=1 Tax=Dialister sp. TaxID=1955814 RepID=UPI003A5BDE9C
MNRPKIICHMETSLDGKIMGKYLWLPGKEGAEDSFYTALGHYKYQAQLLGRTTIDDNYTLYRKPEVNEKAPPVPEGDFLAEGAKLGQYLIAMDSHGRLAWEDNVSDGEGKKAHVVEILTESTSNSYKDFLRRKGISYLLCGKDRVDLALACEKIRDLLHVDTLILGGGAVLNWSFLQAGLVDEVSQVIAPAADGSKETQTLFMAKKGLSDDQPMLFTPLSVEIMADDAVWIRWKVDGKSDIHFEEDPEFRAVQEMVKEHRGE